MEWRVCARRGRGLGYMTRTMLTGQGCYQRVRGKNLVLPLRYEEGIVSLTGGLL